MAKGSMKNIWRDKRENDERLQKLASRKKQTGDVGNSEAAVENSAELKPEEKQEK